jgi:hypothetical protein
VDVAAVRVIAGAPGTSSAPVPAAGRDVR